MKNEEMTKKITRYAPILANVVICTPCACFWGLATWLLGSPIWWIYALIAWISTFVALACVQVGSEYNEYR